LLINADAKQLEWRCVAHLANDQVAIAEINEGRDFHRENQDFFKLPSRVIAKRFLFRAIYKGKAHTYAFDPEFSWIGNEKFWQGVIDRFYEKYQAIADYHTRLIQQVVETGKLVMPTGRIYEFEQRLRKGTYEWNESDICNYPVQGFAADLMAIIRVNLRTLLAARPELVYLFCNTVHDSILLDVDNERSNWYNICIEINKAFNNTANNYEQLFRQPLLVPMACDLKVGINWLWMHNVKI
jgi:DNA polymerase I-like protein with 3'-5' exonuclease and polymerase domains